MHEILIIDDDVELCELVSEYLKREGLSAHYVHSGEEGIEAALDGSYKAIVLDVMLPSIGGFEVLRRLRSAEPPSSKTPVIMLTARGDEVDRVLGLELGADDYLPKPFSSRELVARIRAVLRRTQPSFADAERNKLSVSGVELDSAAHVVTCQNIPVELTSVEFKFLEILIRSAGEVVAREDIAEKVLGRKLFAFDRSIDTHVSNLRRKLDTTGEGDPIKTIRGIGYIFTRPSE
ncbi:MAG: response regulator transcription factor [Abditibacteriaceae bacterium]